MPPSAAEPDREEDIHPSHSSPTLVIPLETEKPSPVTDQCGVSPIDAEAGPLSEGVRPTTSMTDLIPGVTSDSIDLLHKLASGDAGHEIIEALAVSVFYIYHEHYLLHLLLFHYLHSFRRHGIAHHYETASLSFSSIRILLDF